MKEKIPETIIEIRDLKNKLGDQWVHSGINLDIHRKEIIAVVGGSGSGKTTLLRNILALLKPTEGSIKIFGIDLLKANTRELASIRNRWGVLFQKSALFSSMTVLDNVLFPLREFTRLPEKFLQEIGLLKIGLVGLPLSSSYKYPSELSGGMQKRAAAARAIALDPELLFLDEPTSGLDPASARELDRLILDLRNSLGLTVILITHDPESLFGITDKVAFLGEGKLLAFSPIKELVKNPHPQIQKYFEGRI